MLLISIHPFALRRLALIVVALAGFSALCFADPVLMARRYTIGNHRSGRAKATLDAQSAAHLVSIGNSDLAAPAVPGSTWDPVVSLARGAPSPSAGFSGFQIGNGGAPQGTSLSVMVVE